MAHRGSAKVRIGPIVLKKSATEPFCRTSPDPSKIGFLYAAGLESEFAALAAVRALASNSFQRVTGVAYRTDFFNTIGQKAIVLPRCYPNATGPTETAGQTLIHQTISRYYWRAGQNKTANSYVIEIIR